MGPRRSTFSAYTWIPLGFAITVIGGGAAWMTRTSFEAQATQGQVREITNHVEHMRDTLDSMDNRLSVIEVELKLRRKENGR